MLKELPEQFYLMYSGCDTIYTAELKNDGFYRITYIKEDSTIVCCGSEFDRSILLLTINNKNARVVQPERAFQSGDTVRLVKQSTSPKSWARDKVGEVFVLGKRASLDEDEAYWYVEGQPLKLLYEEIIELFVEPPLKFPTLFYVRYTRGEPLWMKIEYSEDHNAWGSSEYSFPWNEKDVERLLYEDKYWEMSTVELYNQFVGMTLLLDDMNSIVIQQESSKELSSIQLYLKETGLTDTEIVVQVDGYLVLDGDSNSYVAESVSEVYGILEALTLLKRTIK